MSNQLESVIDELITALTRFAEALRNKKGEDVEKQSSPKEKQSDHSIPPETQKVTFEDVRGLMTKKRAEGKLEQIQKLIQTKYSASRLSKIDPMQYPQLFKDVEEL